MMAAGAAVIWELEWTRMFPVAASCVLPLGWGGWKAELSSGMVRWTLRVDPGPPWVPLHVKSLPTLLLHVVSSTV